MNKKIIFTIIFIFIILSATTIYLCFNRENAIETNKNIVVSNYEFKDYKWTRETEQDIEYISFSSNGDFSYYCACGNPVNDSDLSETYSFDDKTNIITLNFIEEIEEAVTTIKIIDCNENTLKLDFNGEIREFIKESN